MPFNNNLNCVSLTLFFDTIKLDRGVQLFKSYKMSLL